MAVITVSREAGSGGAEIAKSLAGMMGYHFVSWDRIAALLGDFGMTDAVEVYDAKAGFFSRFVDGRAEVTSMHTRLVRAIARHGNAVILGRGGYAALQGFADVLNVRIQAPLPLRAMRVLQRGEADSLDAARAGVTELDKRRAAFVESSYRIPWDSTQHFDLVIDTGKVSPRLAVQLIAQAGRAVENAVAGAAFTGDIEEDAVVNDAVAEALGCHTDHGGLDRPPRPEAPARA